MPVGSSSSVAKYTPKVADTTAGTTGATGAPSDYKQFLTTIAKNPTLITGYSKLLKTAGYYKGSITDKYTPALQRAFDKAEEARLSIFAVNPMDRNTFLAQPSDSGTGAGKLDAIKSVTVYTPETAKVLIESVIRDTLGRDATAAEIKKYTATLKSIQGKATGITQYSTSGGVQTTKTTPGISEKQYLVDQVAGTDEAKANKVLGFYETFMNALGGR